MKPREVIPGRVYMITRRCTQRQFLLRPDRLTNQAILYCLAEAAKRFGIEVIAIKVMSNHHHTLIRDPNGSYPAFLAHFHKLVAKVVNCLRGRWENLWATEQTNMVRLVEPDDAFGRMIYTLANAVEAQLVERAHHWPGVSSLGAQLRDEPITVRRPHGYFDKNGDMPEQVELRFVRPPGFEGLSLGEWAEKIREAIQRAENDARRKRAQSGARIVGRKAVRRQSWRAKPTTREPRRNLSPRVACRSKWARIAALQRNKTFEARYRAALQARRAGDLWVVFPAGTYQLRVRGLVCVEPQPPPG